jgi:hypothetical protein
VARSLPWIPDTSGHAFMSGAPVTLTPGGSGDFDTRIMVNRR